MDGEVNGGGDGHVAASTALGRALDIAGGKHRDRKHATEYTDSSDRLGQRRPSLGSENRAVGTEWIARVNHVSSGTIHLQARSGLPEFRSSAIGWLHCDRARC